MPRKPITHRSYDADIFDFAETARLVAKAKAGDIRARNKIIDAYRGYITCAASIYKAGKETTEDLVIEGVFGLIEAIRKYDPNRGVKLLSFASWYIRQRMLAFLATYKTISLPLYPVRNPPTIEIYDDEPADQYKDFCPDDTLSVLLKNTQISDRTRVMLDMYMNGYDKIDIARRLHITPGSVSVCIGRSILAMRKTARVNGVL